MLDKIDTAEDPKLERMFMRIHDDAISNVLTDTVPTATTVPFGRLVVFDDDDSQALYIKTGKNRLLKVGAGIDPGGGETVVTFSGALIDADLDTKIQVEESADEDIIRFDIAGTEQFIINDGVIEPTTDNDIDLGSSSKQFKNLYIDGSAYIDGLAENMLVAGTNQIQFFDDAVYISSKTDGHLDLDADVYINANGPTHIVSNDLYIDSDQQLHFEGIAGDTYMKWNSSSAYMELYVGGSVRVQF